DPAGVLAVEGRQRLFGTERAGERGGAGADRGDRFVIQHGVGEVVPRTAAVADELYPLAVGSVEVDGQVAVVGVLDVQFDVQVADGDVLTDGDLRFRPGEVADGKRLRVGERDRRGNGEDDLVLVVGFPEDAVAVLIHEPAERVGEVRAEGEGV